MINLYGSDLIGRIDVSWTTGRADARKFYMKDHLGSIRQTINESGTVTMAMDYYAFGGTKNSYIYGGSVDKYKFTSKERDTETGLDYFGARYYDSKIGRWMSVDPLADKYPGLSPYNYCVNNPLKLVDPNGMWPFWYHDQLIFLAFGKGLDSRTINRLVDASHWADDGNGTYRTANGKIIIGKFQDAEFSFIHAMKNTKNGNYDDKSALYEIDNWLQGKQSSDATFDFGLKLHTIMDLTCNEHYLRSWDGNMWTIYTLGHFLGETFLGSKEYFATTEATTRLMNLFRQDYDAGKIRSASNYRKIYNGYYNAARRWVNYDPQYQ